MNAEEMPLGKHEISPGTSQPLSFFQPVFRLIISLLSAVFLSSLTMIWLLYLFFSVTLVVALIEEPSRFGWDGVMVIPLASAFFAFYFGSGLSMLIVIQTALLGLPTAVMMQRLRLNQGWVNVIAGFLVACFPWSLIIGFALTMQMLTPSPPDLGRSALMAGVLLVVGVCGGVGGFGFWMASRLLHRREAK